MSAWPGIARASAGRAERPAFAPRSPLLEVASRFLLGFEARCPRPVRSRALRYVLDQIRREDANTDYICIGPISKLLHTLVWHFERPGGKELAEHRRRLGDYLYQAADGLKMNGYDSSRLWDTAFAAQAVARAAGRMSARARSTFRRGLRLPGSQSSPGKRPRARALLSATRRRVVGPFRAERTVGRSAIVPPKGSKPASRSKRRTGKSLCLAGASMPPSS